MPRIRFLPMGLEIEVATGTRLFDAALAAGVPVASSCSGDAVCGRCHMQVLEGVANLSRQSKMELRLLEKEKSPMENRISCLTLVRGDCVVTTSYWG